MLFELKTIFKPIYIRRLRLKVKKAKGEFCALFPQHLGTTHQLLLLLLCVCVCRGYQTHYIKFIIIFIIIISNVQSIHSYSHLKIQNIKKPDNANILFLIFLMVSFFSSGSESEK